MQRFVVFVLLAVACISVNALTDAERQKFVDMHNQARDNVPIDFPDDAPATCITHVVWDTYLENLAQNYIDGCPSGHSSQDYRKYSDGSYVGENLAWSSGYSDPIAVANDGWYNEYKDYTYSPTSRRAVVGHYTQMVWNKTIHIGCGWKKDCTSGYKNAICCHYWPGGNYIGQYPWIKRTSGPAPTCPATTSSGTPPTPTPSSTPAPTPTPTPTPSGSAAASFVKPFTGLVALLCFFILF